MFNIRNLKRNIDCHTGTHRSQRLQNVDAMIRNRSIHR
jgi:hypothetical protein